MKQLIRSCLFLFALLFFFTSNAQFENAKWYFGGFVCLDFMTNPPTVLNNGALSTMEGCSTISDATGNLLFYSDGIKVWNKQHALMINGTGLNGGSSTTQSALIVKKPGSSSLYYVFTMGVSYPNYGGPLNYSIVDMTQAGGMGSVITKNVFMDSICTEKLAAARHCNGVDAWIIMHSNHSNSFKAFLLSSSGLNINPVVSSVGTVHNSGATGYLKVSPNGQKLGLAVNQSGFELYDFDKATGIVSNPLMLGGQPQSPYGCEFSPDGSKFYGANGLEQNNPIHQWNLCAGSNQAIVASHTLVGNVSGVSEIGSFQLGLDGKIYVSRYGASTIGIINNPNAYGTGCNFVNLAMSLAPNTCYYAFQNCINDLGGPAPGVCYAYDCNSPTFIASHARESSLTALYPNPMNSHVYLETS
ncbi:MAG TPA: hypothetical protein PL029_09305, partial [Bacteroidia bacterium]|nr:hypothetical protein [Bacteroidia bacterium]